MTSRHHVLLNRRHKFEAFKPYLTKQREAIKSMIMKSESFLQCSEYSWSENTIMTRHSTTFCILISLVFLRISNPERERYGNGKLKNSDHYDTGLEMKAARTTVQILCFTISISTIGYLLFLIKQTMRSLTMDNRVSHTPSIGSKMKKSTFIEQNKVKWKKMISCLEEINLLYLKTVFNPLIVSATISICYIVCKYVCIEALYHDIISWVFFDVFLVAMGIVLIQLASVHCFFGLFDKISILHFKVCGILKWDVKWDPLLEEEMMKPIDEMLPVCKALKILQWMIYFIIINVSVMCIAHFS